jgi:eukaryotic-like serine/threonine-protein kinase
VATELIAGRFELEHVLGRGGMSEVWLARDLELDRPVAVKILSGSAASLRFDREAKSGAALSHPNVVGVFDYGEVEGRSFLVLEYLPGGTLQDVLAAAGGAPLDDDETRRIASDVAAGLAHPHDHGIVHRDLKPSNILFDDEGTAKIADFGIARGESDTTLTPTGALAGTVQYMAPEQAAGEGAGPESDVYAFGVILFELLTGRPAFDADSPIEAAIKRSSEPAPRVESVRADAPPALAALTAATLATERSLRPADGAALLDALEGRTAALPAQAAITEPVLVRAAPSRRRRLALALTLSIVALAGVAAAILLTGNTAEAPAVRDRPAAPTQTAETRTTARSGAGGPAGATGETVTGTPAEGTTTRPETGATTSPGTTAPATTETTPTTTTPTTTAPSSATTTTP